MKIFFYAALFTLVGFFVKAQSIHTTYGQTCSFCLPGNWYLSNVPNNFLPSISNQSFLGGDPTKPWSPAIPSPPPSNLGNFLSLYSSPTSTQTVNTLISGLTPGKTYYLKYHIMSSKNSSINGTGYADSGSIILSDGNNVIQTQNTSFTVGQNTNTWILKILAFTPPHTSVNLTAFSLSTLGGYINLDIGFNAISECLAGTEQVSLSDSVLTTKCPTTFANLNSLVNGSVPQGSSLVWFTNPNHTGSPYGFPTLAAIGTYYAFFYDSGRQCYNTNNSLAKVRIKTAPQVTLVQDTIHNICPTLTANLYPTVSGSIPSGATLAWFSNPTHTGSKVANPSFAGPGTYYAFFYYQANNCYNTDNSTSVVTVEPRYCNVALNLKAYLQGAMDQESQGPLMQNYMQTSGPNNTSLLPTLDPYGTGKLYPQIADENGPAGKIVDWVNVTLNFGNKWSEFSSSRSLLLKTNGEIVEADGTKPIFTQLGKNVRIILKHRNHIPVMSNSIQVSHNTTTGYDFSSSLASAYSDDGYPDQMVLKNGAWCLWAGDLNQDYGVDATDYNGVYVANQSSLYGVYLNTDLNCDGGVDATDLNIMFLSNKRSVYSILAK